MKWGKAYLINRVAQDLAREKSWVDWTNSSPETIGVIKALTRVSSLQTKRQTVHSSSNRTNRMLETNSRTRMRRGKERSGRQLVRPTMIVFQMRQTPAASLQPGLGLQLMQARSSSTGTFSSRTSSGSPLISSTEKQTKWSLSKTWRGFWQQVGAEANKLREEVVVAGKQLCLLASTATFKGQQDKNPPTAISKFTSCWRSTTKWLNEVKMRGPSREFSRRKTVAKRLPRRRVMTKKKVSWEDYRDWKWVERKSLRRIGRSCVGFIQRSKIIQDAQLFCDVSTKNTKLKSNFTLTHILYFH